MCEQWLKNASIAVKQKKATSNSFKKLQVAGTNLMMWTVDCLVKQQCSKVHNLSELSSKLRCLSERQVSSFCKVAVLQCLCRLQLAT
mmetsp:Transcript_34340/g.61879  ORF Transcript_34340/g.61879 Transcript_34340/m.61879 type:complete len:87 (+) Transcript_34340:119-379(+)